MQLRELSQVSLASFAVWLVFQFNMSDIWQAMRRIRDMPPPRPRGAARCPPDLLSFVEMALVRDPAQRQPAARLLHHPFLRRAGPPALLVPLMPHVHQQPSSAQ